MGYAQFLYDVTSGAFKPYGSDSSFGKKLCHQCPQHERYACPEVTKLEETRDPRCADSFRSPSGVYITVLIGSEGAGAHNVRAVFPAKQGNIDLDPIGER
jgi:hypothetical protein